MTYIALLRGINVGPGRTVKMADLVKVFRSRGNRVIATYLQSGNVVFQSTERLDPVRIEKLEAILEKKFGFKIPVIIRTPDEIRKIISGNPLLKDRGSGRDKLHVTFLQDMAVNKELVLQKTAGEEYIVSGREVYLYCPEGYGKTRMNNQAIEKKLEVTATTRNWKTVNALADLIRKT
jgi:uncharacterized protein (DUF1697 family)